MSRKKTRILCVLAFLISMPVSAQAESDLSHEFAICAGLLRAELEFQWLFSDPEAEQTAVRSQAMAALLSTMIRPENSARLLSVRIEAGRAHSALLHRGVFNDDEADAIWARKRAARHIAGCNGMLLI